MSQYIVLSSAYRDRLLYPNPADYSIPYGVINDPNENYYNALRTTNPIAFGMPIFNTCWTNWDDDNLNQERNEYTFSTSILAGNAQKPILDSATLNQLLKINVKRDLKYYTSQPLASSFNILRNYYLRIFDEDGSTYQRKILEFNPITFETTLEFPLPNFEVNMNCEIVNPLEIFAGDSGNALEETVFIGGDFESLDSIKVTDRSIYAYNVNQNEVEEIIDYRYQSGIGILRRPYSSDYPTTVTDQYICLGPSKPILKGKLCLLSNQRYYQTVPNTWNWIDRGDGYLNGKTVVLRADDEEDKDLDYFHLFSLTSKKKGPVLELNLIDPRAQPSRLNVLYSVILVEDGKFVEPLRRAAVRIATRSNLFCIESENDLGVVYFGNYFFPVILSTQYVYDGTSIILQPNNTINPQITNDPITLLSSQDVRGVMGIQKVIQYKDNKQFIITQQYLDLAKLDFLADHESDVPDYMNGLNNFLIIPFSEEGVSPLNFSGSALTNSQMQCYSIEILSLTLPNKVLSVGEGLLSSAYPFVFVEIENQSMPSSGNYFNIVSNNPFSRKASFICAMSDLANPNTSPFIKISSDGAKQITKFSPFDNLRVRISLPNGATFETNEKDYYVPGAPNALLQTTLVLQLHKH
jgi:hypothetical protein